MWLLVVLACTDGAQVLPRRPVPTSDSADTDLPTFSTPATPTIGGEPALVFDGPRPRHLLMISLDTTRRDHVAPYTPDGTVLTPFLTGKMAEGVRLDQHQQCSNWTYASTSCTLQGRYHEEQGYIPAFAPVVSAYLPDGQRSFAVRLGAKGYATVLISSNAWLGTGVNNAQGYDYADLQTVGKATTLATIGRDEIVSRLAVDPTQRWFLHLHLVEPHPPYTPPDAYMDEANALPPLPEDFGIDLDTFGGHYDAIWEVWPDLTPELQDLLEQHLRARYRGEVRWLDDQLVDIWQMFEDAGMLDDTLVLVWTDHGEQFWEHGNQAHAYYLGAEENDGVAFFWAHNLRPRVWEHPTHAVDLLPTALHALGVLDDPDDPTLSGYVIGGGMPAVRNRFGMTVGRQGVLQSVIGPTGWKLVLSWSGDVDLYDRNTDPAERVDLYAPDHPEVGPLWEALLPRVRAYELLLPARTLHWPKGLPEE